MSLKLAFWFWCPISSLLHIVPNQAVRVDGSNEDEDGIVTDKMDSKIKENEPYGWYTAQGGKLLDSEVGAHFETLWQTSLKPRLVDAALDLRNHEAELKVISDYRKELASCVRKLESYFTVTVTADEAKQRCNKSHNEPLVPLSSVQPTCSQDMLDYFLKGSYFPACMAFTDLEEEEGINYTDMVPWMFGDPDACNDDNEILEEIGKCGVIEREQIDATMTTVQAAVMKYIVSMTRILPENASGCNFDWKDDYNFKNLGRLSSFVPASCAFHVDSQARCDAKVHDEPLHSFRVGSLLGVGAKSTAWKIHDIDSGTDYALRVTIANTGAVRHVMSDTDPISSEEFGTESALFGSLQLVNCFAASIDSDQGIGFQLLELADGDLSMFLNKTADDKDVLVKVIGGLLKQLVRLHSELHLSHNDLKPQNILYKETWTELVKIADYDTVTDQGETGHTPQYDPPDSDRSPDGTRDMFAIGLTIYEVLKGAKDHPKEDSNFIDCYQMSTMQQFRPCSEAILAKRLQLEQALDPAIREFKQDVLRDVVIPCVAPKAIRATAVEALTAFEALTE